MCPTSNAEFRLSPATSVLVNDRLGLPPQAKYSSTALKLFSTTPEINFIFLKHNLILFYINNKLNYYHLELLEVQLL